MTIALVGIAAVVATSVLAYLVFVWKALTKKLTESEQRNADLHARHKELLKRLISRATKPDDVDVAKGQSEIEALKNSDHETKTQGILRRK
jgi:hypothetical protein